MKNKVKIINQGSNTPPVFEAAINEFLNNEVEQNEWILLGIAFTTDGSGRQTANIILQGK